MAKDGKKPRAGFAKDIKANSNPPELPQPGPRAVARAQEATARNAQRSERVHVSYRLADGVGTVSSPHANLAGWHYTMHDALGTTSTEFVEQEFMRLSAALRDNGQAAPTESVINSALAVIDGSRPANEVEAMLASQAAVTHALAMDFVGRTRRAEDLERLHAFGSMATRLLRTFTMQTEALAKLKRGGEQTVRVEHVHVHSGGQAIVGNVGAGAGGSVGNGLQPLGAQDPGAVIFTESAALLGEEPERQPVPKASGKGAKAVPASWRGGRRRSAAR